jgi:hypothetical protein
VSIKAVLTQQILELFDDVSSTHPAVASTADGLVAAMVVLNNIKETEMLESGRMVSVPHDEVIEILFEAHTLRNKVLGGNAKRPGVLAKNIASHGVIGDVSEPWLSCNECGKWRIVESYEYMERYSGTAIWRCQDGGGDWKTLPNPCSAPESCSKGHTTIAPPAAAPAAAAAAAAAGAARSPSPSRAAAARRPAPKANRANTAPRAAQAASAASRVSAGAPRGLRDVPVYPRPHPNIPSTSPLKGILKKTPNTDPRALALERRRNNPSTPSRTPPGWKPMGGDARGQKRRAHGGSHGTTASREKKHRVE